MSNAKVWILNVGEPMAVDQQSERQLRMGLIADALVARGCDVTWWTSSFDHNYKRQRYDADKRVSLGKRYVLHFLHARPYSFNISLGRLVNHRQLGKAFERHANETTAQDRPDVIFATMPIVELAAAASRYGRKHSIPVVIDVRDLHPDIYLTLVPQFARPLAKVALGMMYRELRTSLRFATSIIAIAPSFLEWALRHAGRLMTERDAVFPLAYPEIHALPQEVNVAAEELRAMGVRADKKILWYVGTFNRWIDLETPIEAARLLAKAGNEDFQLVISGSGDFDEKWRALAAGLPNVVFTGWIGVPHIIGLRGIAWAGLAPYRQGFNTVGNKLFEYMAGRLPILLSIGGDARAMIQRHDCGLGYTAGKPETLITSIESMASDGVRERMAANSLNAYRDNYSAVTVYPKMIDHVLSLAERGVPVGA
ncbi:MAG TPA: glycosyltransferase [Gemmatimonadaceae bacterium]|nr:glycosyltransferase [Gemmatimonadaceae bacterium]